MSLKFSFLTKIIGILLLTIITISCNRNCSKHKTDATLSGGDHSMSSEFENIDQKIKDYVSPFILNRDFDGFVLVHHDNKLLISDSFSVDKEFTPASPFMIGSITKTFTAEAINTLITEKVLKPETKISEVIKASQNHEKISIQQLLTHSSGIPDYYSINEFKNMRNSKIALDEFYQWIRQFPFDFDPGTSDSYSNSGYNILALAIELASNRKYHDYLKKTIFLPLEMTSTRSIESGIPFDLVEGFEPGHIPDLLQKPQNLDYSWLIGSGSVYSTAEDLLLWGSLVKNRMRSDKNWKPFGWGIRKRESQLYLEQNGRIPGFSASMHIYPETDYIIIALSRIESDAVGKMTKGIADILHNVDVKIPEVREVIQLSDNELSKYEGVYQIAPSFLVTVSAQDTGLGIASGTGSNLHFAALDALSDDNFFFRVAYTNVRFEKDKKGIIKGLFWGESGPYPKITN